MVMHKFRKKIVSPGNHKAVKNGSTREIEPVTIDRIRHWAEIANEMIADGLKIPNPFLHYDDEGNPPLPVTIGEEGELIDPITGKKTNWNAALNGGFWDALEVDSDGSLWGIVEAPGNPDDPNTPAGKLGTTIQETSVGIAKEYHAGNGKVYKDCPVHIASCVKAVEANQENFIPLYKGEFSMFSMSTLLSESDLNSPNTGESSNDGTELGQMNPLDIKTVLKLLKEFAIDLPNDTTQDNIIERLVLVLTQKKADEEAEDKEIISPPPKPSGPKTQPNESKEKAGIVTMSEQVTEKNDISSDISLSMTMSVITKQTKKSIKERVQVQIKRGIISQETADKLFGDVELFTMSATDFDPVKQEFKDTKYEFGLACLEAISDDVIRKLSNKNLTTMNSELTEGYQPDGSAEMSQTDNDEEPSVADLADFRAAALSL